MSIAEIRKLVEARGISRLCHFTPSRKLAHILADSAAIMSTQDLKQQERDVFDPTDLERVDGYHGHVCCSVEYPNAWYFAKAQTKEILFKDWVILLIDPSYMWRPETLFCPRNAAAEFGRLAAKGPKAFSDLFAASSGSAKCPPRGPKHLGCCPTDDQAEVLVAGQIAAAHIQGVVTSSGEQAALEHARLQYLGLGDKVRFFVAPSLYNPRALATAIRSGTRPLETPWTPST